MFIGRAEELKELKERYKSDRARKYPLNCGKTTSR